MPGSTQAERSQRCGLRFAAARYARSPSHCEEPYTCPFYEHCHDDLPEDPFAVLPRLTRKLRERMTSA
jgi:hypothetical protein